MTLNYTEVLKDRILNCDCFKGFNYIDNNSIDLILTDLPYGITDNSWDKKLDLVALWSNFNRVKKEASPVVLTACQPFTTELINSNLKAFKYLWYWEKEKGSNPVLASVQPQRVIEDILVFYDKKGVYHPPRHPLIKPYRRKRKYYGEVSIRRYDKTTPVNLIRFPRESQAGENYHPTQKPLKLMEYLIMTYSNEGDFVLDPCAGSGTTLVACKRLNRRFIGFEVEKKYFEICKKRLKNIPERLDKFIKENRY